MWSLWWRAWGMVACACAVVAQHRIDQDSVLSPRSVRVRDREQLGKPDEPTCEQLKAMWRFSKRQARAPEIMNEVTSYRDPLMYNEWPVFTAIPRAPPRFRYGYPNMRHEYGRVMVTPTTMTAAAARNFHPDRYGTLPISHASGKILRYPGPSRQRIPYQVPTKDRFETLKKLIRQEHIHELQRTFEAEQKQHLKDMTDGKNGEEYVYGNYEEQEPRGLQPIGVEYPADEPSSRHRKPPSPGGRQVYQFNRYSDSSLPTARRSDYHQIYYDYPAPDLPYPY